MIARERLALSTPFEAPEGELESLIAGLFIDAFDVDRIGANDDFFDLGGDSLLSETLSMLISERTGVDFQISALIEHGSPRRIAALLAGLVQTNWPKPIGEERTRPPIFIVPGLQGFILPKPAFRQAFAVGQELFVFELPGIRGGRCYTRVEDIAAVYVRQLLETYPKGPILLAAFCVGGLIALEMGAQLAEMGRPICQMVLLDPGLPKASIVNIKREIKRARKATGIVQKPSRNWVHRQLLLHHLRRFVRLLTHGNANLADDELQFRNDVWRKERKGRAKYTELRLSTDARAKLRAAFRNYKPRAFHGAVTILSARERDPMFRDSSRLWNELLPQRNVHMVFEEHDDIGTAAAARLMQSIFDTAVAEADSSRISGSKGAPLFAYRNGVIST